jgi:hypothetical protein
MSLVQLSRLKSQLNALTTHFNDPVIFKKTLLSLFLLYEKKDSAPGNWQRKNSRLQTYNIPESVMSELESKISGLSRIMPEQALFNADILWGIPYYEPKKIAIVMVSNLNDSFQNEFLQRINSWLLVGVDDDLIKDILATVEEKPAILKNKLWLDLIRTWLNSNDIANIKLGLQALDITLSRRYQNLPEIFSILTPLISKPQLVIQKEIRSILQSLIVISPAETASFVMMVRDLYPNDEVLLFLRKCIPLFDNFFQEELRKTFSKS